MAYDESFTREVNGVKFEVFIEEKGNAYRKVTVHDKEKREEEWHSYLIARDERRAYKPGFISRLRGKEYQPLTDRSEHVREVFNKAIADYFNRQNRKEEIAEEIEANLDATKEVWNEEL